MPLQVQRLRDSRLASRASGDEFRAAVILWCVSWHQLPAGSLPDDDQDLADFAGYGRTPEEWARVRDGALRGWVKCSDGRLYHAVVAEKVIEALGAQRKEQWKTECARIKKHSQRHHIPYDPPDFDEWVSLGCPRGQPLPVPGDVPGTSSRQNAPKSDAEPTNTAHPPENNPFEATPQKSPGTFQRVPGDAQAMSSFFDDRVPALSHGKHHPTEEKGKEEKGKEQREDARAPAAHAPTRPVDVPEQVWTDWLTLRRSKRAPVTQTVLDAAISEAAKANISLDAFLRIWCLRGTQGLQAEWLKPDDYRRAGVAPASRHRGLDAKDYREGVTPDGRF